LRLPIDAARARGAQKRGGEFRLPDHSSELNLDDLPDVASDRGAELLALDDALSQLECTDPRKARIVELRFFGGLSVDETAEALKVSPQTVMRDWRFARLWLARELAAVRR
jgi:RNA polymerase sigma-70 factor, ECF subfamily